jgi:hypothetical protein
VSGRVDFEVANGAFADIDIGPAEAVVREGGRLGNLCLGFLRRSVSDDRDQNGDKDDGGNCCGGDRDD